MSNRWKGFIYGTLFGTIAVYLFGWLPGLIVITIINYHFNKRD